MSFHLSRPHGSVRAGAPVAQFSSAADAVAAIAAGRATRHRIAVVGALSFDAAAPDALVAVAGLEHGDPSSADAEPLSVPMTLTASVPTPEVHRERVAAVIDRIVAGDADKVVLARSIEMHAAADVAIDDVVAALAAGNHERNGFRVDLTPAGAGFVGHTLVGASPESLVRKTGDRVTCRPYAGSAPRSADPDVDSARAAALLASAKDHYEHQIVVAYLTSVLAPLCTTLSVPDEPILLSTGEMWHLATPIEGVLRDPEATSLDLAMQLHPTPAICGTPTEAARTMILETEEPRGFYAGAIGWCDTDGDGEWMVSIRCAEVSPDRRTIRAWSGGGIVAQSDPAEELAETSAKFATVLRALGCPDLLT
ncbi:isochorismate synthase [Williamsia sp.]|uniref:isochorismate synthase n=1 Tax=Williamsia sp. TaxID=1872085 RepID=UPI001A2E3348|nr:isochorismate synthase [Williamsia sp.]MBJ7287604.1 isochorismate synthase [Williamsia sp.]